MKTNIFKTFISLCIAGFICLAANMTVQAAPVTMADGNLFDAQYYATAYPDVVAVFGTDANMLYLHYVLAGKAEGRLPYAAGTATTVQTAPGMITLPDGTLFDPVFYATAYPDVAAVFGNDPNMLATHYMLCGKAEGRLPFGGTAHVAQIPVSNGSVPGIYNGMVITKDNWMMVPYNTLIDMGEYFYIITEDRIIPGPVGYSTYLSNNVITSNNAFAVFPQFTDAYNVLIARYPELQLPAYWSNGLSFTDSVVGYTDPSVNKVLPGNMIIIVIQGFFDHDNRPPKYIWY